MKVIAVQNQKGGVGKTTLSTQIARALQMEGNSVILVDADPEQGSAQDWAASGNGTVLTVGMNRPRVIATDVPRLTADYIVIDGAPQVSEIAAACTSVADLVLIPVQPSPYDVWAAGGMVSLVQQRQAITGGTPAAAFVINRLVHGTILGNEVVSALEEFDGIPVLGTAIHQRQAYPQLAAEGKTVLDSRRDRIAADEVLAVVAEVKELLAEHPTGS